MKGVKALKTGQDEQMLVPDGEKGSLGLEELRVPGVRGSGWRAGAGDGECTLGTSRAGM